MERDDKLMTYTDEIRSWIRVHKQGTATQIANYLRIEASTVSSILKRLVDRGLLQRDEEDSTHKPGKVWVYKEIKL
jgi:predicted transcriptional regulator